MRPSLYLFAFISWRDYAGAVRLYLGAHPTQQSMMPRTALLQRKTATRGGSACVTSLAVSDKEDQGDDTDSAYLSLTKLTREQVG